MSLSLQASSIIIGQPSKPSTGNCDPFGCPGFLGLGTYQQVYLSSAFPGSIDIFALTFFDLQVQNLATPAGGTFTLSLSYTSNSPGALDITSPNNNIAANFQPFFSGTLPDLVDIGNRGRQMIITGTPFVYDPAVGNLLLTVAVANPSDKSPKLYLDQAATAAETSNAYFGMFNGQPVVGGNDIGGLVTQFSYTSTAVPEPGSLLLVVAGAVLAGCRWRLRRSS